MKRTFGFLAAATVAIAPGVAVAQNAPHHETGQLVGGEEGLECEDGVAPSQSDREPGPGSPFQEDSKSGAHYAGEQAGINDKNTASVSQYDIACFRGQDRPER